MSRNLRTRRNGTLYIAVMGTASMVSIAALAAMHVARVQLQSTAAELQRVESRALAESAVEYALTHLNGTPDWRTLYESGVENPGGALGNGVFSWAAVDSDGDLADDETDSVTIRGVGTVGQATSVVEVDLESNGSALSSLEVAFHCGADLVLTPGQMMKWHNIYSDQTVSANGQVDATAGYAKIEADIWATGAIEGDITGNLSPNQSPPRQMPGNSVFDHYKRVGTWIDVGSFPESGGYRQIECQVISPNSNPWGATNPEGIYVIDCQGESVRLNKNRIVGTLVLLNNGPDTRTEGPQCCEPAVSNYPLLLVENDLTLDHVPWPLNESFDGRNYNPPGTPYNGEEDVSTDDTLAYRFNGLVYVGGKLCSDEPLLPTVHGVTICSQIIIDSIIAFNYDSVHHDNPPPGFRSGNPMQVIQGSWRRASR